MTVTVRLTISNRLGLHARAATKLVQTARSFRSEIRVTKGDMAVNGKSIMGVLMLAAAKGSEIEIQAEGDDAEEAVAAIRQLVDGKFGEDS